MIRLKMFVPDSSQIAVLGYLLSVSLFFEDCAEKSIYALEWPSSKIKDAIKNQLSKMIAWKLATGSVLGSKYTES